MTFLYPLGFLALIAIPALILIYIIKNRYTEQTVSSTYLWTLSEKFLRRRIPINRITGLLSLILQILAVLLISVIIAHPVLFIKDAAREYCFILDGSGSMNIAQGGSTRFEAGKKKIADIIKDSKNGSTYTLIYAGDEVFGETFTGSDGKDPKQSALETLYSDSFAVSYSDSNPNSALTVAQNYFDLHPSVLTYLVTDRSYTEVNNVTVIKVASANENYGISDVEYEFVSVTEGETKKSYLQITGSVVSYGSAATVNLDFYFNGSDEVYHTSPVEVLSYEDYLAEQEGEKGGEEGEKEVKKNFTYQSDLTDFESFRVRIRETDSLAMDNEAIVYNVKHATFGKTLVVYGKTIDANAQESYHEPYLLKAALLSSGLGETQLEMSNKDDYEAMKDKTGFGLYIFYGCMPAEMPREGVVWFINPTGNLDGTNFSFQGSRTATNNASYSKNTSSVIQGRLEGVSKNDFELDKYVQLGVTGNFDTLITCDGNPLLLVGTNTYGNREVVFAFDFGASATFVLSSDCTSLTNNMLKYSFPSVVEKTSFYSGDTLEINIINGCSGLRIDTPLGRSEYPDISTAVTEYSLSEVGIYTVRMTMKNNTEQVYYVYSALPVNERVLTVEDPEFIISGEAGTNWLPEKIDNLLVIFIILAVIAVADYGVYCYEQYQLR